MPRPAAAHDHGVAALPRARHRQRDIAGRLGISQPPVSRLLTQAEEQGIIRTVVVAPDGIYPEPEEILEDAYGLCWAATTPSPASSAARRRATSTRPRCGVRAPGSPELVVAITLEQLRTAGTRVVAGGTTKWAPLHAALCGGWADVLVTDLASARYLISHAD